MGQPIFPGETGVDQFVSIAKMLGTPTRDQVVAMNPDYMEYAFPHVDPQPWSKAFRPGTPADVVDYVAKLLVYDPRARPTALQCCAHALFDGLREQSTQVSSTVPLPDHLFTFTREEVAMMDAELTEKLVPSWYRHGSGAAKVVVEDSAPVSLA